MNRRKFLSSMGIATAGVAVRPSMTGKASSRPEVAITIDDMASHPNPKMSGEEMTHALISVLERHSNLKAAVFVAGRNVDNEAGARMLKAWSDAGHLLGNHTYSHPNFNSPNVAVEDFERDILHCEQLLKSYSRFRKYFRFPMLHEGNTRDKRDRLRAFLKQNGYRTGHVTIDTSEWYIDVRMRERLSKKPSADLTPYRAYYLDHIWNRALYYQGLSRGVLGRNVRHTLLIHHTLLNALYLDDLLKWFKRRGWKLIDAELAFQDPVFESEPDIVPAGESVLWALAKQSKKFWKLLRYPGEDGDYEKTRMDKLGL